MESIQEKLYKELMINYAHKLQHYWNLGKSLDEIRKISFQLREKGEDIPYMAKLSCDSLIAQPTKTQMGLWQFFEIKAEGFYRIPKYTLTISQKDGVKFIKTQKNLGKTQKISLI